MRLHCLPQVCAKAFLTGLSILRPLVRRSGRVSKEPMMISRSGIAYFVAAVAAAPSTQAQQMANKPDSSGYVAANGVDYWFEIHGTGEPLLLLHGGLFSTGMFGPTLTRLAEKRR